ncbi:MAG: thiol protease/hemagglutinin PrtT [Bacteroidales bacterium]|nr:thiol protease/hemagglutinin PrtT [Bacteroidales bacterium]
MKKCISIILVTMLPAWLFAEPIDSLVAKQVATTFMENQTARGCLKSAQLTNYQCQKEGNIYIVNNAGGGWVLVSADDCVRPILAYSPDGEFSTDNIAPAAKAWFDSYNLQIEAAQNTDIQSDREVSRDWKQLKSGEVGGNKGGVAVVEPLIKTMWGQDPWYNVNCPNIDGQQTATGCVATAMAQVMKYWEWPKHGVGFHEYKSQNCGTVASIFGDIVYDWDNMPVQLYNNSPESLVNAVAQLMNDCGVSVDMNYGLAENGGSSAFPKNVKHAMMTYFKYSPNMTLEDKNNFTNEEWIEKLKNELNLGRPILYYGYGEGGGHAFICDGYAVDNSNYHFHFNWGWNGQGDGYYYAKDVVPIPKLENQEQTGANKNHIYKQNQQAYFGVEPNYEVSEYDLRMYDSSLLAFDENLYQNNLFWLGTDTYYRARVANYGDNDFTGSFAVAVFDFDYRFVNISNEVKFSLPSNYETGEMDFKIDGTFSFVPSNHYVAAIMYKDEKSEDWTVVDGNIDLSSAILFDVNYSQPISINTDISVFDEFKQEQLLKTEFVQDEEYTCTISVINEGVEDYTGGYVLSLANTKGEIVKSLGTYEQKQPLKPNQPSSILFSKCKIEVEPGTYLLNVSYVNGEGLTLAGAVNGSTNPVFFDVVVDYAPDKYEDNDIIDRAYPFELEFDENNHACAVTVINDNNETHFANLHKHGDVDYYKFDLEQGYNYEVKATVINKTDNPALESILTTDDVIVEYSYDGEVWFEGFDYEYRSCKNLNDLDRYDVLSAKNGGTIYVRIYHPWGQKGVYYFYADISRTQNTAISSIDVQSEISVYPNPAVDYLNINLSDYCTISNIVIYDHQGRQVLTSSDTRINVSALNKGIYIVEIRTDKGTAHRKFTKQ